MLREGRNKEEESALQLGPAGLLECTGTWSLPWKSLLHRAAISMAVGWGGGVPRATASACPLWGVRSHLHKGVRESMCEYKYAKVCMSVCVRERNRGRYRGAPGTPGRHRVSGGAAPPQAPVFPRAAAGHPQAVSPKSLSRLKSLGSEYRCQSFLRH